MHTCMAGMVNIATVLILQAREMTQQIYAVYSPEPRMSYSLYPCPTSLAVDKKLTGMVFTSRRRCITRSHIHATTWLSQNQQLVVARQNPNVSDASRWLPLFSIDNSLLPASRFPQQYPGFMIIIRSFTFIVGLYDWGPVVND